MIYRAIIRKGRKEILNDISGVESYLNDKLVDAIKAQAKKEKTTRNYLRMILQEFMKNGKTNLNGVTYELLEEDDSPIRVRDFFGGAKCSATMKNGKKCSYKAKYNGKCGCHKK